MKAFSVLFEEQNSPAIQYNGKIIYRFLRCTESGNYSIRFRNVSTNAKHMQFLMFHLLDMKGNIYLNDKPFLIPKSRFPQLAINEEELSDCNIRITLTEGDFLICNGEDTSGNGLFADSLIFGAALTIERLEDDWFRLNCNDTENDDDFDDLIFEMKAETAERVIDIIEEWRPKF